MAWRGNSGTSSKSSSSSGRMITKSGIVKIGSDGIARNSDGTKNSSIQAYADYAYGDKSGNDVNRTGMSVIYNKTYDGLSSGKGLNGSYLPVDSAAYQDRYGSSGGGGGSSAYKSYLNDARRSAIDAQNARIQAALDQVAGQQADINKSANDAAQQAYIAKEKMLMQNPQQLAALGISGGGSESALLGINTGYENNRNTIMQNRDRAIRENENQQNQIRATGDASLADIDNNYATQLAQYAAQQAQYEQQRRDQLNDIQSQRDYEQQVWERNNAYAAKLAAQKAQTSTGSKLTPSQALTALESGYDTPEIRAAIKSGYGDIGFKTTIPGVSNDTAEMLNRWWSSNSRDGFSQTVQNAIDNGLLTYSQYNAWLNSR